MTNLVDKLFHFLTRCQKKRGYDNYVSRTEEQYKKKLPKLKSVRKLTPEQKSEVLDFYRKLTGKDVSLIYHEYFYSRTGKYSQEYMPVDLYEAELIGRANNLDYFDAYSDKNMDEVLLPGIQHPKSILKNINGYFYYENRPVSKEDAIAFCDNLDDAIIKPSMSSKGNKVQRLSVVNGTTNINGFTVRELFDDYGSNFIIQKAIHQHERMSVLNPTSINTIRVLTYRSGMEIILVYAVVRIGRKGQVIDNQSAGGISAMIDENGKIGKYAFGVAGDDMITSTDSGVVLEGYEIPSFGKVVNAVKSAHFSLPFFNLIGWDIAIDDSGEPVLVEWNGNPGPSQTACGTGLGKYTERIISEIWSRKNTRKFDRSYC